MPIWTFWIFAIVLFLLPFLILFRRDQKKLGSQKAWILSLLMSFTLLALLFLLYPKQWLQNKKITEKPSIVLLEDISQSVQDWKAYEDWQEEFKLLNDRLSSDFEVKHYQFGSHLLTEEQEEDTTIIKATNISKSIEELHQRVHPDLDHVFLFASDGIVNQGMDPYYVNYGQHKTYIWLGLGDSTRQKDIVLDEPIAAKKVKLGDMIQVQIPFIAQSFNDRDTRVRIGSNGKLIDEQRIKINQQYFYEVIQFEWEATTLGWQEIQINTPFLAGEVNSTNNQQKIYIEVIEEPFDMLIWAAAPHPDVKLLLNLKDYFAGAKMSVHYGEGVPGNLEDYQLVIGHQLKEDLGTVSKGAYIQILGTESSPESFKSWNLPNLRKVQNGQERKANWAKYASNFTGELANDLESFDPPPLWYSYQIPEAAVKEGAIWSAYKDPSNVLLLVKNKDGKPGVLVNGVGWWRWHLNESRMREESDILNSPSITESLFLYIFKYVQHHLKGAKLEAHTNKTQYYNHESVYLSAQVFDEFIDAREEHLIVKLYQKEEEVEEFSMQSSGSQQWQLDMGKWPEGLYEFVAMIEGKESYHAKGYFEVDGQELESMVSQANWDDMAQWADKGQGAFFAWDQTADLLEWLREQELMEETEKEVYKKIALIDQYWWLIMIILLIISHMFLRRKWNAYL